MRQNNAGCLTGFLASFSRFFLIFAWFARPVAFNVVFNGAWLLPCLGILFLPFTTLMYVILVTNPPGTISGLDWLWLILAVLIGVEEFSQRYFSTRTFDLIDLSMSYLGLIVGGWVALNLKK